MIGNQQAEDLRRACDALEAENKRLRDALSAAHQWGTQFYSRAQALLAERDRLLDAVQETVRVIESNPSSITDTVWVTGNMPETLLDRCRAALAQEGA